MLRILPFSLDACNPSLFAPYTQKYHEKCAGQHHFVKGRRAFQTGCALAIAPIVERSKSKTDQFFFAGFVVSKPSSHAQRKF